MKILSKYYGLGLAVLVLVVFGRVVFYDFVNFDDPIYVLNYYVQQGLTLDGWVFAFSLSKNFGQSLVWLSYMLDFELYGNSPAGYHLTNLLLHICNTLLFYSILHKMTGAKKTSAFASVLFAIHPLRVESVAWISDRKDLLCMLFALLAIEFYRRFVTSRLLKDYCWVALFFILSLLSKPVIVTLPCALLLLDFWPLHRFDPSRIEWRELAAKAGRLLAEKIPLLLLSVIFSWVAYQGQALVQATVSTDALPIGVRWANAPVIYMKYLAKGLWPVDLAVHYPLNHSAAPLWQTAGSVVVLVGISAAVILTYRRYPFLLLGWFWFLGNLVPVIGIIRVGDMEMADRYTYIPLIGLIFMVAWGLRELALQNAISTWFPKMVTAGLTIALVTVSWFQVGVWENSSTLFRHVIAHTENNALAHNNLGSALLDNGDVEGSLVHFQKAVQISPNHFMAWMNLGSIYRKQGRTGESIQAYLECLRIEPDNVIAHYYLGQLYHQLSDGPRAVHHTRRALALLQDRYGPDFDKTRETQNNLQHYEKIYNLPTEPSTLPG